MYRIKKIILRNNDKNWDHLTVMSNCDLMNFILDEITCDRPIAIVKSEEIGKKSTHSKRKIKSLPNFTKKNVNLPKTSSNADQHDMFAPIKYDELISSTKFSNFFKTFEKIVKILLFGLVLCYQHFLYDLIFTPILSVITLSKILVIIFCDLISFFLAFLIPKKSRSKVINSRRKKRIEQKEILNFVNIIITVSSIIILNNLLSFTKFYHYLRQQGMFKMYVLFNMIDMIEKTVSSLAKDTLQECYIYILKTVKIEENKIKINYGCLFRFILRIIVAIVINLIHIVLHLSRGLLMYITMRSNQATIILLILSNNWTEIKSTIYKKTNDMTLWIRIAGDIIELFNTLFDAFFVGMQILIQSHETKLLSAITRLFKYTIMMICVEMIVDFTKYAFLVKFNDFKFETLDKFFYILCFDFLYIRSPSVVSRIDLDSEKRFIPYQALKSFYECSTYKLGFSTSSYITLIVSSVNYFYQEKKLHIFRLLPYLWVLCLLIFIMMTFFLFDITTNRKYDYESMIKLSATYHSQ